MVIELEVYEDAKHFPRMRLRGAPYRSRGERPSLRTENAARDVFADLRKLCHAHSVLTESAEKNRIPRSAYNVQGLFRLAILNEGNIDRGEIVVAGEKIA